MRYQLEHTDIWLTNVHEEGRCAGEFCTIHNKSEHSMRGFPQDWRSDIGVMERVNPFGGACPDPDSPWPKDSSNWVHGCIMNPAYPSVGMCSPWFIDGVEAAWINQSYAVTKDGRVWSFLRLQGPKRGNLSVVDYTVTPKNLKQNDNGKGYKNVCLTINGKHECKYVHRLVLDAWKGECPEGMESRHLDGDRSNNNLENLARGTWSDNHADKVRHGRVPKGNTHGNSKLTEKQVIAARNLWAEGNTLVEVVDLLDIKASRAALHDAVIGRTWVHVGGPTGKRNGG